MGFCSQNRPGGAPRFLLGARRNRGRIGLRVGYDAAPASRPLISLSLDPCRVLHRAGP